MHATPKENLKLYGDAMVQFVDTLEKYHKQGRFQKMPIGPLANCIEVKDASYRQYIEDALGIGVLTSFCVDNNDDLMVFREISKKMGRPMPVICSKFHNSVYNVTGKCVVPDDHSVRLMDLIIVENPIAMNCLIDQCSIEMILFTKSFEHAAHITSKKENVPKNLMKVVLLEPYSDYFPAPAYRSYSKYSKQTQYLRVSAAQREM